MSDEVNVSFEVNGRPAAVRVEPRRLLADVLRHDLGLTGTHLGCEHGVCGACTVRVDGLAVRSCLILAPQVAGCSVETVEGLTAEGGALHSVQQAFADQGGLQCGFCTPGMLMAIVDLLQSVPDPSGDHIRDHLSGNICRCTGYLHIVRAVQQAAAEARSTA